ncbi:hypothetical protein [Streptomyces cinereoruber]|uniref:hypothetical protein n=1 Tax=Streptomyces cinereoruber TaxID=67260 RepID=UPI003C2E6A37
MESVFGAGMASRGKGAGTGAGKPPVPPAVPATFTAPVVPAPAVGPDKAAPEVEAGEGVAPTADSVPPIGGKAFEGNSNNSEGGQLAPTGEAIEGELVSALSDADRVLLTQCESRIRAFGKAAADAGEAFETIKEKKLQRHYGLTWAEYTLAHWGLSASQVDRLIAASPVMRALSIPNEGTARELVPAYREWGVDSARALWEGTKEGSGGKPTAKVLRAAVKTAQERAAESKKAPAPEKLATLARKTVARVVKEEEAAKAERTAAKKTATPAPLATVAEPSTASAPSVEEASAWTLPDDTSRELSRLIAAQAQATGRAPEEVALEAVDVLREHYGTAGNQAAK